MKGEKNYPFIMLMDLLKGESLMNKRNVQFVMGYIVGGLLVLVLIPLGLYGASIWLKSWMPFQLISNQVLRLVVAAIILLIGFIFAISSLITQNTRGEGGPVQFMNTDISPRTQKLVTSGPYRYTRNPMLFGAFMVYLAFAVYLNSLAALIIVLLFICLMLVFVKRTEEPRLLRDFGSEYEEYSKRVSFIIPWLSKK